MSLALALLACATAPAALAPSGQHIANWTYSIVTEDGDALVEQHETATVTLTMDLSVNPPEPGISGQPICNWSIAVFDTLNVTGSGSILAWRVLEHYAEITGDLTTTDGASLYGTHAANFRQRFAACEPCPIFEFTWSPESYQGQVVPFITISDVITVIEGGGNCAVYPDGDFIDWPAGEAVISIEVACAADANLDGALNILDFVAFQLLWQDGEPAADCDGNGAVDVLDLVCFQQLFQEGCP